jgi:hypothetical protein
MEDRTYYNLARVPTCRSGFSTGSSFGTFWIDILGLSPEARPLFVSLGGGHPGKNDYRCDCFTANK